MFGGLVTQARAWKRTPKRSPGFGNPGALLHCRGVWGRLDRPARTRLRPEMGVLDRSTSSVQQPDASLSSRSPDRRKRPSEFLHFDGSPLRGSLVGSLSRIGHCPNRTNTASRASPVHNLTGGLGGMFSPNGYMHEPPTPLTRTWIRLLLWGLYVRDYLRYRAALVVHAVHDPPPPR